MGTGPLIAIDVMLLYIILGPVVLLGIYVLFDFLEPAEKAPDGKDPTGQTKQKDAGPEKDPALWTTEEIDTNKFEGMGLGGSRNWI